MKIETYNLNDLYHNNKEVLDTLIENFMARVNCPHESIFSSKTAPGKINKEELYEMIDNESNNLYIEFIDGSYDEPHLIRCEKIVETETSKKALDDLKNILEENEILVNEKSLEEVLESLKSKIKEDSALRSKLVMIGTNLSEHFLSEDNIYSNDTPLANVYESTIYLYNVNNENEKAWDLLFEELNKIRNSGGTVNEGLFSSILGGAAGLTFGPSVMRAVCEALGVDPKGTLGSLLTSRIILTTVGAKIGWRV